MATTPAPPASKREALLALLDRGMVMLHLDARREGVAVPTYLAHEEHLRLNLSYRFLLEDLVIDDWGVSASLSFRGQPFGCRVPWSALFALTRSGTDEGWLWPSDLPPELAQGAGVDTRPAGSPEGTPTPMARPSRLGKEAPPSEAKRHRPRLREVPLEPEPDAPAALTESARDGAQPEADPPRPPPTLRLVK